MIINAYIRLFAYGSNTFDPLSVSATARLAIKRQLGSWEV